MGLMGAVLSYMGVKCIGAYLKVGGGDMGWAGAVVRICGAQFRGGRPAELVTRRGGGSVPPRIEEGPQGETPWQRTPAIPSRRQGV